MNVRINEAVQDLAFRWNELCVSAVSVVTPGDSVPPLRGFVRSQFAPWICAAAKKTSELLGGLDRWAVPEKRGIILGSFFLDASAEQESWKDLIELQKLSPIMFPQMVPSSTIGFIAKELTIHGPMTCMASSESSVVPLFSQAADWILDSDAEIVLVVVCDVPSIKAQHYFSTLNTGGGGVQGGAACFALQKKNASVEAVVGLETLLEAEKNRFGMFFDPSNARPV